MKRLLIFALLLTSSFGFAQRLPKDAVPSHYTIHYQVDLAAGTFSGEETIQLRLAKASQTITLNSVGLSIRDAYVTHGGKKVAAKVEAKPEQEMVTFEFPQRVPAGATELHFQFAAPLRDDLRGLYGTKSARRAYAATQFEGTYARMAFPCFDEPEFKATFDIAVETDEKDTAISNGAIWKTSPGPMPGKHTIQFATSPKISTYLVALAVGDFGCVEGGVDGIPIRICAVPEKKELGSFALKAAESFLHFYNGYYGIKYPFKKLDMVALPNYEWGGMENTAAVFYKERALLIDEKTASVGAKRGVAGVVAHEMAHQWFGDLVTMQWWDNVWLNEGFATWMATKPLAQWDPQRDQNLARAQSASFVIAEDSLASTRPIRANGNTPEEIKELFDGVAYEKGAAVLRMVETFVGEEVFRKGVNAYLAKHANGNATAEDFWSELTAVSKKPVDKIMATFIDQPGVPLVRVDASCNGEKNLLKVTQERFGGFGSAGKLQTWNVPVCSRKLTSDPSKWEQASVCVLMTKPAQEVTFDSCDDRVVNAGGSGYYRTAYAPALFAKISAAAAAGKLAPAENIVLLSDQWALVRAGQSPIGDFLDLASNMRARTETVVIQTLLGRMENVRSTFTDDGSRPKFDAWEMGVLKPTLERVGLEPKTGDNDEVKTLRPQLFAVMGETGDAATIARAREIVEKGLIDPASVDAGMANVAFSIAAQHGDAVLYDRIKAAMGQAKSPEQSSRLLFTLAQFRDPALVKKSLEYVRSPQMPAQDVISFMSTLIGNRASRDAAWDFLKEHWMEMREKVVSFGGGGAVGALSGYCDTEHRKDIEEFFREHRAPGAERTVKQTLERISSCVEFKQKQGPEFEKWLGRAK